MSTTLIIFSSAEKVLVCPVDKFDQAIDGGLFWGQGWKDYQCARVKGPVLVQKGKCCKVEKLIGSSSGMSHTVQKGLGI